MSERNRRRLSVEHEREVVTYAELWHAAGVILRKGQEEPRGAAWQFLSSIILSAFAFEAFLNYVGSEVVPNWDDLERALSPEKKLRHLCIALGVDIGGRHERQNQTIRELVRTRNDLAHGRSQMLKPDPTSARIDNHYEARILKRPLTEWEEKIQNEKFAERVREDLEQVFRALHKAMPTPKRELFTHGIHSSGASLRET
ncbi:MAG: hypothetical protein RBS50_15845 [Phenylobacterium sp.]|uniref:hypothetical protein n=1 Tax=Phenylobacterium sp. TaxID=1871053 RepID=UPI002A363352|nr:hypothetical protein [Phenylobacterium sp.]MDX9999429.1 hypothetical protein [Phenylobacterium sp.]